MWQLLHQREESSPGAGAPGAVDAASPVPFCLLTSLASTIALTSADALFCKVCNDAICIVRGQVSTCVFHERYEAQGCEEKAKQ